MQLSDDDQIESFILTKSMCRQGTRNSRQITQSLQIQKQTCLETDLFGGGEFTYSCMHRVTLCNGAWRERWSNSKDQQEEPVGRLNEFQHKKNTLKKELFVSLNCFLESLSLHYTFLCNGGVAVPCVSKVIQWAIKLIQWQINKSNHSAIERWCLCCD